MRGHPQNPLRTLRGKVLVNSLPFLHSFISCRPKNRRREADHEILRPRQSDILFSFTWLHSHSDGISCVTPSVWFVLDDWQTDWHFLWFSCRTLAFIIHLLAAKRNIMIHEIKGMRMCITREHFIHDIHSFARQVDVYPPDTSLNDLSWGGCCVCQMSQNNTRSVFWYQEIWSDDGNS